MSPVDLGEASSGIQASWLENSKATVAEGVGWVPLTSPPAQPLGKQRFPGLSLAL